MIQNMNCLFIANSRKHIDISILMKLSTILKFFSPIFNFKEQLSVTKQKQIYKIRRMHFPHESNGAIVSATSGVVRYG